MLDKARGQHLHDKSTRSDVLSNAEQEELKVWYAQQDAEESRLLARPDASSLIILREHLDATLAQAEAARAHVQTLAAENESIRQDIHALTRRLAQTAQPSAT